jgi:hypothetical protein
MNQLEFYSRFLLPTYAAIISIWLLATQLYKDKIKGLWGRKVGRQFRGKAK